MTLFSKKVLVFSFEFVHKIGFLVISIRNQKEIEFLKEILFFKTNSDSFANNDKEAFWKKNIEKKRFLLNNSLKDHNEMNLLSKKIDVLEDKLIEKNTMFF